MYEFRVTYWADGRRGAHQFTSQAAAKKFMRLRDVARRFPQMQRAESRTREIHCAHRPECDRQSHRVQVVVWK